MTIAPAAKKKVILKKSMNDFEDQLSYVYFSLFIADFVICFRLSIS